MDTADGFTGRIQMFDRLVINIKYLQVFINLQTAQGDAGNRLSDKAVERSFLESTLHIFAAEVFAFAVLHKLVVAFDGCFQLISGKTYLLGEFSNRIGLNYKYLLFFKFFLECVLIPTDHLNRVILHEVKKLCFGSDLKHLLET